MAQLDPTGEVIDKKFRILEPLGEGGFASVYTAEQIGMERKVAVKFLNLDALDDDETLARFNREAKILAGLNHKNIVACYAYGLWMGKVPYLVLELLEGESLRHKINQQRQIPWDLAFKYGSDICSGLSVFHKNGIVHRDLKPENIIITPDGQVKLIDFGLASMDGQRLTKTGMLVGSLLYLSPEQAQALPLTTVSDIYSLGAVLYHAIAGEEPFSGTVPFEILAKHVNQDPKPLNHFAKMIPDSVNRIIMHAMEKEPPNRFQTANEFAEAMNAAIQNETAAIPTIETQKREKKFRQKAPGFKTKLTIGVACATAFVGLVAATPLIWEKYTEHQTNTAQSRIRTLLNESDMVSPKTARTNGSIPRNRQSAALKEALALAKNVSLPVPLQADLLIAQGHGLEEYLLPNALADGVQWYNQVDSFLAQTDLEPDVRTNLVEIRNRFGFSLHKALLDLLKPKLAKNIGKPHSFEIDRAAARVLESYFASRLEDDIEHNHIPLERMGILCDWVILLDGTNQNEFIYPSLTHLLTNKRITANERAAIAELLAVTFASNDQLATAYDYVKEARELSYTTAKQSPLTGLWPMYILEDRSIPDATKDIANIFLQELARPFSAQPLAFQTRVTLINLYMKNGEYQKAIDLVNNMPPQFNQREQFALLCKSARCNIAMQKVQAAREDIRKLDSILFKLPGAHANESKELADVNQLLNNLLQLQKLNGSGRGATQEAYKLRLFRSGYDPATPWMEEKSVANIPAVLASAPPESQLRDFLQEYNFLIRYYLQRKQWGYLIYMDAQYSPDLNKLLQKYKGTINDTMRWDLVESNTVIGEAYCCALKFEKGIELARRAMQTASELNWQDHETDVLRTRALQHAISVAIMSKKAKAPGVETLIDLIVKNCEKSADNQLMMQAMYGFASQLEADFLPQSEILYRRAGQYFEAQGDVSWQLRVLAKLTAILKKQDRLVEANELARTGRQLSSRTTNPLDRRTYWAFVDPREPHR